MDPCSWLQEEGYLGLCFRNHDLACVDIKGNHETLLLHNCTDSSLWTWYSCLSFLESLTVCASVNSSTMDAIKKVSPPILLITCKHLPPTIRNTASSFNLSPLTPHPPQRMEALRVEADDSASRAEELQAKVKSLEQENLSKEQEITSLQHKQRMLEAEVEKLEGSHEKLKGEAADSAQHGTQNENLTRKVQVLEEELEVNDKNLRETNEK